MSSTLRQQHFKLYVDDLIRARIRSVHVALRALLGRLICAVRSASKLLSHHQRPGSVESDPVEAILGALIRMAQHAHAWIRSPEEWLVPAANPAIQFRSLVSHFFDRYPVPSFMPRVLLFNGRPWEIELYLHLAAGRSIRQFALPHSMKLLLTKKAAAWFMKADDDLEPLSAMRWAQIRSLGGDRNLARKLCTSTILKLPTCDEPFWESVVRFLVRHQPICVEDAISIVTFIQQQKFLPARTVLKDRNWELGKGTGPLQPDFTLRGRTLRSLKQHMANWIAEVGAKIQLPSIKASCDWGSSGIAPIKVQLDERFARRTAQCLNSAISTCSAGNCLGSNQR